MRWLPGRRFWLSPWPWVVAAVLLAGALAWRTLDEPAPLVDSRPLGGVEEILALRDRDDLNLLFILIDTLRADRLSCYGYERKTSPLIDLLASNGVRFARHLSQSSWTKCSMASLWTGLYPARAGVTRFDDLLSENARLPAEILREAGFRTAGLWRNGWVEGYFGFGQGFEVYSRPGRIPVPPDVRRENPTLALGGTDLDLAHAATEFLRVNGHDRWFLYLHMMDVHQYTYAEESAKFGTSSSDVYDNSILHVDTILDHLMGYLLAEGYFANTLIVIGADHGEAFGERGSEGHARMVFPETTEVPLILSFPFRLRPGAVVRQRTANVDLWPTLLELLGLPALEVSDGRSRVPEILAAARRETGPASDTVAIAHLDQTWGKRVQTTSPTVSLSEDRFRYVVFRNPQGQIQREFLFDREHDAAELVDRLADEPEVTSRMRERADSYLEGGPVWGGEERLELEEMQLNQLRALGYAIP